MLIKTVIDGIDIEMESGDYYFSPEALDKGTAFMLSCVKMTPEDKVLDLGCGYGPVGIYAAKKIGGDRVLMCDISEDAIALSKDNLRRNGIEGVVPVISDGLKNIDDPDITIILSNPPYHTDFSVAKGFIEDSFRKLPVGGRLYMVTKRKAWYRNKITAVFGGVRMRERDGYIVFEAEKRGGVSPRRQKPKKEMSRKLQRKLDRENSKAKDSGVL